MNATSPSLYSTFFLTVLLAVGLIFFLKASTKDRTTEMILYPEHGGEDDPLAQACKYFCDRGYRVVAADKNREIVTLCGNVRPSVFLAILLVALAAIGFGCLGLVLAAIAPQWVGEGWWLALLAPLAGIYYWQGAARQEEVRVEALETDRLRVRAHKDELRSLQQALQWQQVECE